MVKFDTKSLKEHLLDWEPGDLCCSLGPISRALLGGFSVFHII